MIPNVPHNEKYRVGNDVIHLSTFAESLTAPFIRKVYTKEEKDYCNSFLEPTLRYASTFAAKEAVFKALKQQDRHLTIPWNKISIEREKLAGKPTAKLLISNWEEQEIALSISHDGDYVWAIALITLKP